MGLSEKAKLELSELLSKTEYIYDDENLYKNIFEILKGDLDFMDKVSLFIDDGGEADFNMEDAIINVCPVENYNYCKKFAYSYRDIIPMELIEKVTKYNILYVMLHETMHAYQRACHKDCYSYYPEVNRLYRELDHLNSKWNIAYKLNYYFNCVKFCFERNANLLALQELIDIIPEDIRFIYMYEYITNYMTNYYIDYRGKLVNPVDKTYKYGLSTCDIISEKLPIEEKLIHGFGLDMMDYIKYIDNIGDMGVEVDTYKEIQRLIRK